jgi:hypothetical protein
MDVDQEEAEVRGVPPSGQTVIEIIGKIWVRSAKKPPYVESVSLYNYRLLLISA